MDLETAKVIKQNYDYYKNEIDKLKLGHRMSAMGVPVLVEWSTESVSEALPINDAGVMVIKVSTVTSTAMQEYSKERGLPIDLFKTNGEILYRCLVALNKLQGDMIKASKVTIGFFRVEVTDTCYLDIVKQMEELDEV